MKSVNSLELSFRLIVCITLCFIMLFGMYQLDGTFTKISGSRSVNNEHEQRVFKNLMDQMDIDTLRKYWLIPPGYKIKQDINDHDFSQVGQSKVVDKILNAKTNGIFVECGASDGSISNTKYFENYRNWTGLLIEPTPEFQGILHDERHAWLLNACIGIKNQTEKSIFQLGPKNWGWSGLQDTILPRNKKTALNQNTTKIVVQCFPFATILKALEWTTVDYFSLDVEGAEEAILNTIPLNDIHI
ncbi:unnamed protein product, partial [Owenia fusiformis]